MAEKRVLCAPIKVLKREKVMELINQYNKAYTLEKAFESNCEVTDAFEKRVREQAIAELRKSWPTRELSRFDSIDKATLPIAEMGLVLYDTTTLLRQEINEWDTFVTSAVDDNKLLTELSLGEDEIAIDVGIGGICYCDKTGLDSKSNLLSISGKDIVGEVSNQTLKFWRKSKATNSQFATAGSEFSFSKVTEKCNNVMRCHTWIENGNLVFQFLTVFYTDGFEENGEDKRFIDLQINVFFDAFSSDEIDYSLRAKFKNNPTAITTILDLIGGNGKQFIQEDGCIGYIFNDTRDVELDDEGWPIESGAATFSKTSGKKKLHFLKKPSGVKNMIRVVEGQNVSYYTINDNGEKCCRYKTEDGKIKKVI